MRCTTDTISRRREFDGFTFHVFASEILTEKIVSEKQYKTQIKKWNLDTKYTKASEYMAMIKTKRRRENENPPKQTRFILRGRPVDPKDINRFEKRASKKGMMKDEELAYNTKGMIRNNHHQSGRQRQDQHVNTFLGNEEAEDIEDLVYLTPSPSPEPTFSSCKKLLHTLRPF